MLSPLPRVYEEGHNGQAVPSEPEPTMVGGDVQVERLTTSAQETKKRLDMEVVQPIKQWMVAYRTIAVSDLVICWLWGGTGAASVHCLHGTEDALHQDSEPLMHGQCNADPGDRLARQWTTALTAWQDNGR